MKAIGGIKNVVVLIGKEVEFEKLFFEMVAHIKKEETGNVYYELYKSRSHSRTYRVTEKYKNKVAWQAHQDSEYGKIYFPQIRAVLESINIEYFDEVS